MLGLLHALLPAVIPVALAVQVEQPRAERSRSVIVDGDLEPYRRRKKLPPATPAVIARAYRDTRARDIIARARQAVRAQDSTLTGYDATVVQRLSAGLKVKTIGRDRLLFRSELAARVRWSSPRQVWIDMLGARTAVPVSFAGAKVLTGIAELVPIPYFPGSERLMWWLNLDGGDGDGDEDMFAYVHPLDDGAEAVYEYASGDSVTMHLPSGRAIALREVSVRAREAEWELITGSLWFEAASGQLVRAVFRPSAPLDMRRVIGDDFEDIPAPVRKTLMNPYEFNIEAFTIEYGLYDERWWLPRSQTARGEMHMGFMRSPASIEQTFRYSSVNGVDSIPAARASARRFGADFGGDIGLVVEGAVDAVVPGSQRGRRDRPFPCELGDTLLHRHRRGALRVTVSLPCDTARLLHSPELPPSIFDGGEDTFGTREARELMKALDLGTQPLSSRRMPPTVKYGLTRGLLRYNRVEGLSAGLLAEGSLRGRYQGSALVRLGTADHEPNGELRIVRGQLDRSKSLGAYRRLEAADDWGEPLGVGNSLSALVFGRDEGFYYRTLGVDLASKPASATRLTWRLFAERQRAAPMETQQSLARAFGDARFEPNIAAADADEVGAQTRVRVSHGIDPRGLRLSADLRAEGAAGTFDYTRVAAGVSASRMLVRELGAAISLGAGTSGGRLPPQRLWRLGGTHTVRGQRPGTLEGDSYWLARGELGLGGAVLRPLTFYDVGWAGDRRAWTDGVGARRGAGVGLSILDGLARIDLARGVRPRTGWRAHLYVEAVF